MTGSDGLPQTIEECHALIRAQAAQIALLLQRIEALEAKVAQNSQNSSKPPSSDGPSSLPPKPRPKGRKRGGQPGHKGKTRRMVENPDVVNHCVPSKCEDCGAALDGEDKFPERFQQWELPVLPRAIVTENRIHTLPCACGHMTRGTLPEGIDGKAFGPRLTAMVGYLAGAYGMSHRNIVGLLREAFGVSMALGSVANCEFRVSTAIAPQVQDALAKVRLSTVVHADETSWDTAGARGWLWVAVTDHVTVFLVHPERSKNAAQSLLGATHEGWLITDRWTAYDQHPVERRQVCLTHLHRQFREMALYSGQMGQVGRTLDASMELMWEYWSRVRSGEWTRVAFAAKVEKVRADIKAALELGGSLNHRRSGRCREILKLESAMWTFASHEGIEPTNNVAERAIRHAVVWRKKCYGSQSSWGEQFVGRILTVHATLKRQGRNLLEFLQTSLEARARKLAAPSLLPAPA